VDPLRLATCLLLSLPAGWFASALRERVPDRRPLFRPLPNWSLSRSYVIVQAAVTFLFGAAAVRFADTDLLVLLTYLLFFTSAVALCAIDLDRFRLPDAIVGGTLVVTLPLVTLASVVAGGPERIRFALIGGGFYFGFLLLAHLAFPRGMGFGDVKLAALLGLFVGWLATSWLTAVVLVLYCMLVGFLVGSAAGLVLFAFQGRSRHYPFGPFLIGGALVVIAFSTQLLPVGV
jgi:leader peptidase (prepilin peptidase) / N-methyltransferase